MGLCGGCHGRRAIERQLWPPLYQRIEAQNQAAKQAGAAKFFRILHEVDSGEWHLAQWAEELGIFEGEMIELDRHVHRRLAS